MTIHELLQAAGLTANDEIPIWDVDGTGEPTKKITAQQLAAAVVALANLVTGVKGDKESNYRHGDVNLTPANIGAHPAHTNLQVTNNSNYTGTTESNAPVVQILDSTGYIRHQLYAVYASDGRSLTLLSVRRPNGASNEANHIGIGFDKNGNRIYSVSDPAAFRLAIGVTPANIGALPLSGGTMSGSINMGTNASGTSGNQIYWTMSDGGKINIRPFSDLFQFVNTPSGGTGHNLLGFYADGRVSTSYPANWRTAIGATNTKVKGNAESSYRTGDVNLTPANIGAAWRISLTATTAATIYAALDVLSSGQAAVIHMSANAFKALTGNKSSISYVAVSGIVYRSDSNVFGFDISRTSGIRRWAFQATITSSAITPGTVYTYAGTAV